ncbi:hypothetical protein KBTX_01193 [wastewater metagenome]|uniref:Uncharacterized protein n=2 Tax=unclassified sequences TaxID=12908 RepID=A0A5B8R815_9ZZZZ|nr:hypothetical protein KBTEX_01193 [uncultured organism]
MYEVEPEPAALLPDLVASPLALAAAFSVLSLRACTARSLPAVTVAPEATSARVVPLIWPYMAAIPMGSAMLPTALSAAVSTCRVALASTVTFRAASRLAPAVTSTVASTFATENDAGSS